MTHFREGDIICAQATPSGTSALHIIRISGPECIRRFIPVFTDKSIITSKGYTLHHGWIQNLKGDWIDEVMLSAFREPKSFTGEESIEITCHGSPLMVQQILSICHELGFRMAYPGEFTFRAFMSGKLNLNQAEAISDLIHAETILGQKAAVLQLKGQFVTQLQFLREKLIQMTALLELELDFSEEDVEFAKRDELVELLKSLEKHTQQLRNSFLYGRAIREGIPTVIAGKPNAGKSTLLNGLLKEDRAIVSAEAGTTRDTIEEKLQINGIMFRLIDTAGLRKDAGNIEQLGIARTQQKLRDARVIIWIFNGHEPLEEGFLPENISAWKETHEISQDATLIWILNKADLGIHPTWQIWTEKEHLKINHQFITLSAERETDVELVLDALTKCIPHHSHLSDGLITSQRHFEALSDAGESITSALHALSEGYSLEMVAADLRQSLYYTGLVTSEVSHEDVLDYIFSKFCIGK